MEGGAAMKSIILSLTLAAVSVLSACALTPQNLRLDPKVSVQPTPVASGTIIGLGIEDSRSTQKLGEVGDPNTKMVDVSLTEDFRPRLYDEISRTLTALGFSVVPYSDNLERAITVDVRRLELSSVKQPFVFDTELNAELGAVARNGGDTYDRLYYVRTRKETAGPPYLEDSNALVNTAVAQALEDILSDQRLFELLKR
jgi:uncharacterized lipoprotein